MGFSDIALGIYVTILYSGLATLLWARLNRIEEKLEGKADKIDINRIVDKLERKADKDDIVALEAGFTGLRSDLTQVALAVGVQHRRAVE